MKSEACEEVLAGAEQKHKAEARQLRETLWARDEEVRGGWGPGLRCKHSLHVRFIYALLHAW